MISLHYVQIFNILFRENIRQNCIEIEMFTSAYERLNFVTIIFTPNEIFQYRLGRPCQITLAMKTDSFVELL